MSAKLLQIKYLYKSSNQPIKQHEHNMLINNKFPQIIIKHKEQTFLYKKRASITSISLYNVSRALPRILSRPPLTLYTHPPPTPYIPTVHTHHTRPIMYNTTIDNPTSQYQTIIQFTFLEKVLYAILLARFLPILYKNVNNL